MSASVTLSGKQISEAIALYVGKHGLVPDGDYSVHLDFQSKPDVDDGNMFVVLRFEPPVKP